MTAQRLSRIAAGIAIVTALGVAGLVTRNVLWPDDPDASLQRGGGKMLGDMAGYVGRVDREARTVDISASPLGIRPVVLLVTNDTAIVVNGKQGAIGDLWKDLPVRVFYEVRDNTRYATSIQVTAGDALAASPGGKDAAPASGASSPTVDPPASGATPRETKAASAPASPAPASTPPPVTSAPPPAAPPTAATRPVAEPPASAVNPARASGPGCRGSEARAGRAAACVGGAAARRRAAARPAGRGARAGEGPGDDCGVNARHRIGLGRFVESGGPASRAGRVGRRRVRGGRLAPQGIRPTLS